MEMEEVEKMKNSRTENKKKHHSERIRNLNRIINDIKMTVLIKNDSIDSDTKSELTSRVIRPVNVKTRTYMNLR